MNWVIWVKLHDIPHQPWSTRKKTAKTQTKDIKIKLCINSNQIQMPKSIRLVSNFVSNLRLSNLGQTRWYTAPALVEWRPKRLETSLYIGCAASARGRRRQPYARRLAAAPAAFGRDLVQVGQHLELSRANAVERAFTEYENSAHTTQYDQS